MGMLAVLNLCVQRGGRVAYDEKNPVTVCWRPIPSGMELFLPITHHALFNRGNQHASNCNHVLAVFANKQRIRLHVNWRTASNFFIHNKQQQSAIVVAAMPLVRPRPLQPPTHTVRRALTPTRPFCTLRHSPDKLPWPRARRVAGDRAGRSHLGCLALPRNGR